ncbi:hypothetical protein SAMN04489729_0972 [Amycolatopsis lurida]|uniref:Uncharacterized protein n=1 Tax=Amycolatopsis lurida NRRL 2430 TaxID=1460371 RepID=A0A2P2G0I2_AMYLU|nr:hypothetical protein [Amycolatopsis lurida]KFU82481.1 hypothetical protein BB31_05815 [Amycolatopsis lurida NRRL 2430]SEB41093.1 hypothetical protein SAMN04489729_0972 [Amycolatopsis lurida]
MRPLTSRVLAGVLLIGLGTALPACRSGFTIPRPDAASATSTSDSAPPTETQTLTVTPTAPSTSSAPGLEPAAIDRVFQVYMNGLANHDMTALRSGTCPRLRATLLGFELHGHYVERWEMLPYSVPPGQEFVTVQAKVTQRNARNGELAGDVVYSWYVERNEDTNYYVCGWLDYE